LMPSSRASSLSPVHGVDDRHLILRPTQLDASISRLARLEVAAAAYDRKAT